MRYCLRVYFSRFDTTPICDGLTDEHAMTANTVLKPCTTSSVELFNGDNVLLFEYSKEGCSTHVPLEQSVAYRWLK